MKITNISIYEVDLKLKKPFQLSGGRELDSLTSAVVSITADNGITGWGESCPWGSDYLPAFPDAVIAGLKVMAPKLLGEDSSNLAHIHAIMASTLAEQPSITTAYDIACHDLAARSMDVPVSTLLGGRLVDRLPLPGGLSPVMDESTSSQIAEWRAKGVREMSTKATGEAEYDIEMVKFMLKQMQPDERIKVDANLGWRLDDAIHVAQAVADPRVRYEQPCATNTECRAFSERTGYTVILDESAKNIETVTQAYHEGYLGGVNLKIGKVGGLAPSRTIRDFCIRQSVPLYVQDAGGSSFAGAAIMHLAHAVPARLLNGIWDCADVLTSRVGIGGFLEFDGALSATMDPGLGVAPDMSVLGEPIAEYQS